MVVRKLKSMAVVFVVVMAAPSAAVAQEQLGGEETVPWIYDGLTWSDGTPIEFDEATGLFRDSDTGDRFDVAETIWGPHGAAVVSWDAGETVVGPSILTPPGLFVDEALVYAGVEFANDLPTDTLRGITVQTDSMLVGCEGFRREVAISVARPGLDVYSSQDEFVGNPGIGHNLQVSFAMDDCVPQAFYLEVVGGEFQSFQSRVGTVFKDDGEVATVTFVGGSSTLDGPFTLSASVSKIPFSMSTTYGYSFGIGDWPDSIPVPNFDPIALEDLSARPFQIVAPPVGASGLPDPEAGDGGETTTTLGGETTQTPSADPSATPAGEAASGGSFPFVPVAVGGVFAGIAAFFVVSKRNKSDKPPSTESPAAEVITDYFASSADDPNTAPDQAIRRVMVDTALRSGAVTSAEGWVAIDFAAASTASFGLMKPLDPKIFSSFFINQFTLETVTRDGAAWSDLVEETGVEPGTPDPPPPEENVIEEIPVVGERVVHEDSGIATGAPDGTWDVVPPLPPARDPRIPDDFDGDPTVFFELPEGDKPQPTFFAWETEGLFGYEWTRATRFNNIVRGFRGTGDMAAVALAFNEFNKWHKDIFGEEWFTWTNDPGPGTLISTGTVEEFISCRQMCCFEFVHLCAYIAGDQLGMPRRDSDGKVDGTTAPFWGIDDSLLARGDVELDDDPERGKIVTGIDRDLEENNAAGYFHVGISIGSGWVVSLSSDGLTAQPISGLPYFSTFPFTQYGEVRVGDYLYQRGNPAPANPR